MWVTYGHNPAGGIQFAWTNRNRNIQLSINVETQLLPIDPPMLFERS